MGMGNCVVVEKIICGLLHIPLHIENKNPLKRTTTELFRGFRFPLVPKTTKAPEGLQNNQFCFCFNQSLNYGEYST